MADTRRSLRYEVAVQKIPCKPNRADSTFTSKRRIDCPEYEDAHNAYGRELGGTFETL